MLSVQPARANRWLDVPEAKGLDPSKLSLFNHELRSIGYAQGAIVRHRLDSWTFAWLLGSLQLFPFLARTGIVCNNASNDHGGMIDSAFVVGSWLLELELLRHDQSWKSIEEDPIRKAGLKRGNRDCRTVLHRLMKSHVWNAAIVPRLRLSGCFQHLREDLPAEEADIHRSIVVRIAAAQYEVLRVLEALAAETQITDSLRDELQLFVQAAIYDRHAFAFLANLGAIAHLLREGISWKLLVKDVVQYGDWDIAQAAVWAEQLANSHAHPTTSPTPGQAMQALSWVREYPEVGRYPRFNAEGMLEWVAVKPVSVSAGAATPDRQQRIRIISHEALDVLDPSVYGHARSPIAESAAANRVQAILLDRQCSLQEAAQIMATLWEQGHHSVTCCILETLPDHQWGETPLAENLLAGVSQWGNAAHPIVGRLLQLLPTLRPQGAKTQTRKAELPWLRSSAPRQYERSDVCIPAEPFTIRCSWNELVSHRGVVKAGTLLIKLGQMLCADRFDRALDVLEELEQWAVQSKGSLADLSTLVTVSKYLDTERDEIAQAATDVLAGRIRQSISLADSAYEPVRLFVPVRCIPCFGDWLAGKGYRLRGTYHATRVDGAEEDGGEIIGPDGKAGEWLAVCLHAHWFLRFFSDHYGQYWSQLYVPEEEREPEDDPERDFRVAVEPVQITCSRELAAILSAYRGRYHGMIPQRAVRAYRTFVQR